MSVSSRIELFYIYTFLIVTCLVGLVTNTRDLPLWASIYDGVFLLYAAIHVVTRGTNQRLIFLTLVSLVYFATNFVLYYVYYHGFTTPTDPREIKNFLFANKFIFYAAVICLCTAGSFIDRKHYSYFVYILLFAFTVKYTFSKFVLNQPRPILVTENNFELMLLLLLYYIKLVADRRFRIPPSMLMLAIVSYVVIISGSRSSILALGCILLFEIARLDVRTLYAGLFALPVFAAGSWYVFYARAANNAREQFFDVFRYEIKDFSILNHMFGSMPLTPLSEWACNRLSFWTNLMSSANDGRCYSLILHSFFMRTYFDHGIFGILFIFVVVGICLTRGDLRTKEVIGILSVPAVCGFSVSSFSSAFVSLPIAMICAWRLAPDRGLLAAPASAPEEGETDDAQ